MLSCDLLTVIVYRAVGYEQWHVLIASLVQICQLLVVFCVCMGGGGGGWGECIVPSRSNPSCGKRWRLIHKPIIHSVRIPKKRS